MFSEEPKKRVPFLASLCRAGMALAVLATVSISTFAWAQPTQSAKHWSDAPAALQLAQIDCRYLSGEARSECNHAEARARAAANRQAADARRAEIQAQATANRLAADAQRPPASVPAVAPSRSAASQGVETTRAAVQNPGPTPGQSAAVREMMDGCRSGHWFDCSRVEEFLPVGSPEVLEAGLKGCSLDYKGGCYSAGRYYEKYSGEPNHLSLAVRYYKQACDGGVPDACVKLTGPGLGVAGAAAASDLTQANEKLCNSGNASACNSMGISLYNGELVARDRAKSLQFFSRGCKLGNKTACNNLAKTQAGFDKTNADAARKAGELAARNDPNRKPGTDLSKADLACLKEEEEVFYTYEQGQCLNRSRDPYGAPTCSSFETVKTSHTRHNLRNICKRTISIEEFCGGSSFSWATLVPGDVYTRKFLYPCRLAN